MLPQNSMPAPWSTGSRVLPTVALELETDSSKTDADPGEEPRASASQLCSPVDLASSNSSPARCFPVSVNWLRARTTPLQDGTYCPTARFPGDPEHFSVVVEFPADSGANPGNGKLRLLLPDLVHITQKLAPGTWLEFLEGALVVARCLIEDREVLEK